MSVADIGLWAGFILTLMVFSYVLGDNFLYRLAVYVFVGLAAGFITIVTVESVIMPFFSETFGSDEAGGIVVGMMPLLLAVLLLLKTSPRLARVGNIGIAFIIGVGAAVALVGAVTGTLIPLARATANEGSGVEGEDLLNAIIVVVGVVTSLVYFQYLARRNVEGEAVRGRTSLVLGTIGEGFIVITLGAIYGAAILTSLTIFSERISFLLTQASGG